MCRELDSYLYQLIFNIIGGIIFGHFIFTKWQSFSVILIHHFRSTNLAMDSLIRSTTVQPNSFHTNTSPTHTRTLCCNSYKYKYLHSHILLYLHKCTIIYEWLFIGDGDATLKWENGLISILFHENGLGCFLWCTIHRWLLNLLNYRFLNKNWSEEKNVILINWYGILLIRLNRKQLDGAKISLYLLTIHHTSTHLAIFKQRVKLGNHK